jgi:hypothetical protein
MRCRCVGLVRLTGRLREVGLFRARGACGARTRAADPLGPRNLGPRNDRTGSASVSLLRTMGTNLWSPTWGMRQRRRTSAS